MRISDKYMVSKVAGENVILPIMNDAVDYNSVFMLNETGMFIVSHMPASHDELLDAIVGDYEVEREDAIQALDTFLEELRGHGILEEA